MQCGGILSCGAGLPACLSTLTTHFVLQDVSSSSSSSVVAVGWWCLLAQAGQPLRQHHPLARGGGGADRHPGVDHRLHWDQVDPHGLYCNCSLLWNCVAYTCVKWEGWCSAQAEMLVIVWELGGWLSPPPLSRPGSPEAGLDPTLPTSHSHRVISFSYH